MNDNLQPLPNEHLEARITAWVLGQASPFEAAELEALCAADPELQLFHNRTQALHSLLLETPPSSADQFWKLSSENRAKLDTIIGPNSATPSNKNSRIRSTAFRAALSTAAIFVITFGISRFYVFQTVRTEPVRNPDFLPGGVGVSIGSGSVSFKELDSEIAQNSPQLRAFNSPPRERVIAEGANDLGIEIKSITNSSKVFSMSMSSADDTVSAAAAGASLAIPETSVASVTKGRENFDAGYVSGGGKDISKAAFARGELASNESRQRRGSGDKEKESKRNSLTEGESLTHTEGLNKSANEASTLPLQGTATFTGNSNLELTGQRESVDTNYNLNRSAPANKGSSQGLASETPVGNVVYSDSSSIRTNPSLFAEKNEQVDDARRQLSLAQGNFDLGKYDDAKKNYELALRVDPSNAAARRGMEKIANSKSDYYRASDQTRSELLMQVDNGWEESVPAEGDKKVDPFAANKPMEDSFAAAADPFTTTTYSGITNVTAGTLKMDHSLNEAVVADNQKNKSAPADFDGFINYGSPITLEPELEKDITKSIEIAQENNMGLSFGGVMDSLSQSATSALNIPLSPAAPQVLDQVDEDKVVILGDIPQIAKLSNGKPSDLSNELSASAEAFSTFSLNISDASFQLARAAIEKGERPDPASIKPEQFYNAVDYGDPAPSASEPVAAAIDQTAHPVIPGRNLVRVALRTASTGRSAAQPLRLTLLVDQSGSMVRSDRRVAMETALAQLATLLTENDQVTVIGFSRTPHLLAESLPGNEAGKLSDIINQTASEGGTNLEQAINLATEQALRHQLAGAQNRIVLFTDGAANLGDADPERLSKKIQDLRQQGLAFDIAGIGTNDVNDRLLSDLARHGNGRYYLVGEKTGGHLAAQLAGAFRPAAENVKVQVKLNPQRVGNYKLLGFEKDRLKTEDFRNDTVDAAELAADEAGVALYQVETLPEGSGEIGEVSVRFRDTASGEMVERKWTIPYDASAPSFDKANPKTQLATLALLAAQKLQTGPLADAIDFSNYSETIAQLKQANANSSKTQQLLNLINSIK